MAKVASISKTPNAAHIFLLFRFDVASIELLCLEFWHPHVYKFLQLLPDWLWLWLSLGICSYFISTESHQLSPDYSTTSYSTHLFNIYAIVYSVIYALNWRHFTVLFDIQVFREKLRYTDGLWELNVPTYGSAQGHL